LHVVVAVETFAPNDGAGPADEPVTVARGWQFERLSIDRAIERMAVEFHPQLTLLAVAPERVQSTAATLAQALGDAPSGVHVELRSPEGEQLVVFRPHGGRHRCVSVATGAEVPADRLAELAAVADAAPPDVDLIARLATIDQFSLWSAGAAVDVAREALADATRDGAAPASEPAEAQRKGRFRRLGRSKAAEEGGEARARRALETAEAAWSGLVGEITLADARTWQLAVESTARVGGRLHALAAVGAHDGGLTSTMTTEQLARVIARVMPAAGPATGPAIVTFPVPDDDVELEPVAASLILEALSELTSSRQVVVVTADDGTADWGRLETHARRARFVDLR
jgi:hypothetical protein